MPSWYGFFCLILVFAWLIKHAAPTPNMVLSVTVGDSPAVMLTNGFLFSKDIFLSRPASNSPVLLKSISKGCLVVPVKDWQSNESFEFSAENAGEFTFKEKEMEAAVVFPKDWKISADKRWEQVDVLTLYMPRFGVKFPLTNVQCWAFQNSKTIFPWDTFRLPPITNESIALYNGPRSQAGVVGLILRATNLHLWMGVNHMFISEANGFSKPFVAQTELDTNGVMQVLISPH